jgi:sulfopyruvate decarboxylase subunit alpha
MRHDCNGRVIFEQKMTAEAFAAALASHCDWFSAVPDSIFRRVLPALPDWHIAPRENTAVAMAFGAHLGGKRPAVLMQNSGLGLCLDALLGTFRLYNRGLLLILSNRGVLPWEEVQHQDWGHITGDLLNAARIPKVEFDLEGLAGLERAAFQVATEKAIVALLIQRGNLDE